jgi:hypothetical protein
LACCEDWANGDDGGYWLIENAETFATVRAVCLAIDRLCEYEDTEIDGAMTYDAALAALGLSIAPSDTV